MHRLPVQPLSERLFLSLGRTAARLPRIRGKTRALLTLYKLLGLDKRHVTVRARLRHPVPYVADLDLHAWLQRVAFLTGGYESETVEFLLRLHAASQRDGYLLDVGANIGLLSIPFALATRREVVAVEAVPDNIAALRRNVAANQLESTVRVIPYGLGDRAAIVDIQVEGDLRGGEGTGTANILPDGSTYDCVRQQLEIRTLDELDMPAGCAVMKIDTDGYDLKVVQGGTRFLQRDRPVIFGEFSAHCMRWHGQTLGDVIDFASAHGYLAFQKERAAWTFVPAARDAEFYEDLLLVPREQQDRFAFCVRT